MCWVMSHIWIESCHTYELICVIWHTRIDLQKGNQLLSASLHRKLPHKSHWNWSRRTPVVVLECVRVRWSVLECVAVCCSVLQCVAACCTMQISLARVTSHSCCCDVVCFNVLTCVAVCCSVFPHAHQISTGHIVPFVLCWNVLECVQVYWSALECVGVC